MLLSDDDVAQDIHRATLTDDAPLANLLVAPGAAPDVCTLSHVNGTGTITNVRQTSSEELTGTKDKTDGYTTSLAQRRSHQRSRIKKKNEVSVRPFQSCGSRPWDRMPPRPCTARHVYSARSVDHSMATACRGPSLRHKDVLYHLQSALHDRKQRFLTCCSAIATQMQALTQDVEGKLAQLALLQQQNERLKAKAHALELAVASNSMLSALQQLGLQQLAPHVTRAVFCSPEAALGPAVAFTLLQQEAQATAASRAQQQHHQHHQLSSSAASGSNAADAFRGIAYSSVAAAAAGSTGLGAAHSSSSSSNDSNNANSSGSGSWALVHQFCAVHQAVVTSLACLLTEHDAAAPEGGLTAVDWPALFAHVSAL